MFGTLHGLNTNNTGKFSLSADSLHSVISQNSSKEDDPVTILYYSNCNIKEHTGRKHTHTCMNGCSQSTGRGVVTLCPPTHHVLYHIEMVLTPDQRTVINHEAGHSTCPTLYSPTGNEHIVLIIAIELWICTRYHN